MDEDKGYLPDFLGLGAQRAGTTWLYRMLKQHPEICTASGRKEAHYFDRYYDRGEKWYRDLFAHCSSSSVKGEITPAYLFDDRCPKRIYIDLSNPRFLVVLREPVERAYSQFKLHVRENGSLGSFEDFLEQNLDAKKRGLYYEQLSQYFDYFDKSRFLILIFEEMTDSPERNLKRVFRFLDVDPTFEPGETEDKVNYSAIPRFHGIYTTAKKFTGKLHDWGLSGAVQILKEMGLKRLFFSSSDANDSEFPLLKKKTRRDLEEYYRDDVEELSKLLDEDMLEFWGYG